MRIQEEGKTIHLGKLIPGDEELLRDLSLKMKENPMYDMSRAIESYLEASETTEAEIMAQIVCSNCREPVGRIANGWPLYIFRKVKGYYCRNPHCEFYRKFIPISKALSLTSTLALPVLHYILRDTKKHSKSRDKDT